MTALFHVSAFVSMQSNVAQEKIPKILALRLQLNVKNHSSRFSHSQNKNPFHYHLFFPIISPSFPRVIDFITDVSSKKMVFFVVPMSASSYASASLLLFHSLRVMCLAGLHIRIVFQKKIHGLRCPEACRVL